MPKYVIVYLFPTPSAISLSRCVSASSTWILFSSLAISRWDFYSPMISSSALVFSFLFSSCSSTRRMRRLFASLPSCYCLLLIISFNRSISVWLILSLFVVLVSSSWKVFSLSFRARCRSSREDFSSSITAFNRLASPSLFWRASSLPTLSFSSRLTSRVSWVILRVSYSTLESI